MRDNGSIVTGTGGGLVIPSDFHFRWMPTLHEMMHSPSPRLLHFSILLLLAIMTD
jgi:hypothetical protein